MMKSFFKKLHTDSFTWKDSILVLFLLSEVLFIGGAILGDVLVGLALGSSQSDVAETLIMYLSFTGIWLVCFLWFLLSKDWSMIKMTGPSFAGNTPGMFLLGLAVGFVMNGICILAAAVHGDIHLYYDSVRVPELLLIFLAVFIQSSAEELVFRGYLYHRLRKGYRNPAIAIVVNSLLFGLGHVLNPGATFLAISNVVLVGIFFSLLVWKFESLWMAMAVHTAWNYTQNIIFGLPNSGIVTKSSIFKLDAASALDSFAYNVGFGVEGTILALAVIGIACVLVFVFASFSSSEKRQ